MRYIVIYVFELLQIRVVVLVFLLQKRFEDASIQANVQGDPVKESLGQYLPEKEEQR